MLLCCITLSSSRENQRSAQEVARRISGAVAREAAPSQVKIWSPANVRFLAPLPGRSTPSQVKSRHTKYPSQTLIPRITLFAICLSFSSPPLHPCRFIRSLFSVCLFLPVSCLLMCWIACLSRWLKIILNCLTSPIPTTMISLALRLLLLPMLNLVKLILISWILSWKINLLASLVKMLLPI